MGAYIWPVPVSNKITSPFGPRTPPTAGASKYHTGIDIGAAKGSYIIATRPGKVIRRLALNGGYGYQIQIDHGNNIKSFYAHCSEFCVKLGDSVSAGQLIAKVGSTGTSTGPHLHFEIQIDGVAKNPEYYVRYSDTRDKYSGSNSSNTSSKSSSSSSSGSADYYDDTAPGVAESTTKEITTIVVKSIFGNSGSYKYTAIKLADSVLSAGCEIMIQNDKLYVPAIEGEIILKSQRKGAPATLKFNVVKDEILNIQEGNPVRFRVDGRNVFYGFIFSKSRTDNRVITVTCYDQIRYLKNEDTYIYENKKYSEVLKMIAADYGLTWGAVDDTGYVIPSRIEEGTLLDILGNASDETVLNTGNLYVLYDDCGVLCLKNISSMRLPIFIDADTATDFKYTSTIDSDTYNKIKLAYDNDQTGEREIYIAQDAVNQAIWGILQYYEKTTSQSSGSDNGSSLTTGAKATSQAGIDLIKKYEGCKLTAYKDAVGIWTIGYGHTGGVSAGMSISQTQAEAYLRSDLSTFESTVNNRVTVATSQNMFDALVSLAFNIGSGAFGGSTLLSLLNQGNYTGAADQFGSWVKAGGVTLQGLVKRRASEKTLFLTGYNSGGSSSDSSASLEATLKEKAAVLLSYYNKKHRMLKINGCFGDVRVRGGSSLAVNMNLGDITVQNYMVVEAVKHTFSNNLHLMDLDVIGIRGEFVV